MSFVFDAAILFIIMFAVARHEADLSDWKTIFFLLGISVISFILGWFLPWFIIPFIVFGLMAWGLVQFFFVSWKKAFIITGIFTAFKIILGVCFNLVMNAGSEPPPL